MEFMRPTTLLRRMPIDHEAMASSYLKASRDLLTADSNAVFAGFSLFAYDCLRDGAATRGGVEDASFRCSSVDITVSLPRSRLQLTRDMMLNLPAWLRHDGLKTSPWALVQRGLRRVHKKFVAAMVPLPSSGIWAELLGRPVAHPETTQVMLAALRKYVPPPLFWTRRASPLEGPPPL